MLKILFITSLSFFKDQLFMISTFDKEFVLKIIWDYYNYTQEVVWKATIN